MQSRIDVNTAMLEEKFRYLSFHDAGIGSIRHQYQPPHPIRDVFQRTRPPAFVKNLRADFFRQTLPRYPTPPVPRVFALLLMQRRDQIDGQLLQGEIVHIEDAFF